MNDNPRRWFQIHLSTAIVLTFICGGIIGANFIPITWDHPQYVARHYGWPWHAYSNGFEKPNSPITSRTWSPKWHWHGAMLNASCAVLALIACAWICERDIRRRFWRFHATTNILMLVIGTALVWANFGAWDRPNGLMGFEANAVFNDSNPNAKPHTKDEIDQIQSHYKPYGWPTSCCIASTIDSTSSFWASWKLFVNVGTAIAILVMAGFTCERLIRRRQVRKP